jgi:hypothetical protein
LIWGSDAASRSCEGEPESLMKKRKEKVEEAEALKKELDGFDHYLSSKASP